MVVSSTDSFEATDKKSYDKMSELKAFDDTKAGVKGLVDAGINKVPQIFILPPENRPETSDTCETEFIFPVIDLEGIDKDPIKHKEIVDKVRDASGTWGFFQVVNHGIPTSILEEMLQRTRQFFEQGVEVKKQYYTRDGTKKVIYISNYDLYNPSVPAANWRDSVYFSMAPNPPSPEEFPRPCREILMDYSKHVMELGCSLLGLLSEGLGLDHCHLKDMDCAEGLGVAGHYYPACPQPELTIGINKHADVDFITVLLQDRIGGLQVLHRNQWVDVPPTPGALVVNIGDLLQLISNDKYISVEHRALANKVGPRISVACFFSTVSLPSSKLYGPIAELLSEDNPPKYRATTVEDYTRCFRKKDPKNLRNSTCFLTKKMVVSSTKDIQATVQKSYDKMSELKAFDDTKAGVKGIVDAGNNKVPQIFILPPENRPEPSDTRETHFIFPQIDLEGIDKDPIKHKEIVDKVRDASETWGFFQVVNHGIPTSVLEEMLQGTRQFFEEDVDVKKQYYTRDSTKKVIHTSNFDLYSPSVPAASWRDTLICLMSPDPPCPEEFPTVCRKILMEFSDHTMKLGRSMLELLSEGLGLNPSHLTDMDCAEGLSVLSHYYPECPRPELTMGISKHSDADFITVLLQDHIGGLQVLHQNQWVDVPPTPGALVVNIGDLLQLISNDKYRVLTNKVGPRISAACFFGTGPLPSSNLYGPITELLSEDNPPKYRATTVNDYADYYNKKGTV